MSLGTWVAATPTGIGSVPGDQPREWAQVIAGEFSELPHLPELPERGPWADMTGRGCALLVDLPVQLTVGRWTLTGRVGRDLRRAQSMLAEDLDAFEESLGGYVGPAKVQVCGPVTLAATVERRSGERVVGDPGARLDLAQSLAEGVRLHLAELRRRLPLLTSVVVQIDEPALPNVVRGSIPSASAYRTLEAVATSEVHALVSHVTSVVGSGDDVAVLHCCADPAPIDVLTTLPVTALSVPLAALAEGGPAVDLLAAWFDADKALFAGVEVSDTRASVDLMRATMSRAGVPAARRAAHLVVTPPCGLAGGTPDQAMAALSAVREIGRRFAEHPEDT